MNLQFLADGLLIGAMVGLGAIGVTLTYSILGFANFVHGEFIAWGAYAALVIAGLIGLGVGMEMAPIGPFSIGWAVLIAGVIAMGFTGGLALALDWLLFSRLRRHGNAIVLVMASFGASMALRAMLEFLFSGEPGYFSRELQIAVPIGLGIRVTPDQMLMLALTARAGRRHASARSPAPRSAAPCGRSARIRISPPSPASMSPASSARPG